MAKGKDEQAKTSETLWNLAALVFFIGFIAVGAEVLHGALVAE